MKAAAAYPTAHGVLVHPECRRNFRHGEQLIPALSGLHLAPAHLASGSDRSIALRRKRTHRLNAALFGL
jgi:hypothetical protein